ncbi:hypothetical protein P3S67_010540 [Capsicum chacoense]
MASASPVASQSTQSAGGAGPVYGPMIVCNYCFSTCLHGTVYVSYCFCWCFATSRRNFHFQIVLDRPDQPECRYYMKFGES